MARIISHSFAALTPEVLFLPLEHTIHIFSPPCNILYIMGTSSRLNNSYFYSTVSVENLMQSLPNRTVILSRGRRLLAPNLEFWRALKEKRKVLLLRHKYMTKCLKKPEARPQKLKTRIRRPLYQKLENTLRSYHLCLAYLMLFIFVLFIYPPLMIYYVANLN